MMRKSVVLGALLMGCLWYNSAGAQAQAGLTMNVLRLDGRSAYVQLPPSIFDDLTEATIEAWVKWEKFNKWCRVFDFGREGHAAVLQNNKSSSQINFRIYDRQGDRHGIEVKNRINQGGWYHVACTCGPNGMELYINGQLVKTDRFTGGLDEVAVGGILRFDGRRGQNYIGKSNWPKDKLFQGYIAEFRVWDHQRSAGEIATTMKRLLTGEEDGLVGYWHFDKGDGTDVRGSGPMNHKAMLMGNAQLVSVPAIAQYLAPGELETVAATHYDAGLSALDSGDFYAASEKFHEALLCVAQYKDCRDLAAESFYNVGMDLVGKEEYRKAVEKLRLCQKFVPGYQDARAQEMEAKKRAVKQVAVMAFDNLSGHTRFGKIGANLADQTIGKALQYKGEFRELVTRDQMRLIMQEQQISQTGMFDETTAAEIGKLVGVHAFVFGKIRSVVASGPTRTSRSGANDSASWNEHTDQAGVEINASFQVIEVKRGTIVESGSFSKSATDRNTWKECTGGDPDAMHGGV